MSEGDVLTEPLYSHRKRPKWGLAILCGQQEDKREFQFQDGQQRVFKEGYWDMMQPVDQPLDRAQKIVRELKSMLRAARQRDASSGTVKKSGPPPISFEEQLSYFRAKLFPEGLGGDSWKSKVRGEGIKKRRKRHREAAIADAREKLGKDAIKALLAEENYTEVCKRLHSVLTASDLTASSDTAPLRKLPKEGEREVAEQLLDLLYGDGPFAARFDRFVTRLTALSGERVRWPMATAAPALVSPTEQICIKPNVFREQARWMAPSFRYSPTPSGASYGRLLDVARAVERKLTEAGEPVRDLLDVFDFVHETLRPKVRSDIETARGPAL